MDAKSTKKWFTYVRDANLYGVKEMLENGMDIDIQDEEEGGLRGKRARDGIHLYKKVKLTAPPHENKYNQASK